MAELPQYIVTRIGNEFSLPADPSFWGQIPNLTVDNYLWLKNGYTPRVEARLCVSESYLYVSFKAFEPKIKVRFTGFQDPVYRDSCVEFFFNPFPEKPVGYINIETNAVGAMLIAVGPDRFKRRPILKEELSGLEIVPSVKRPVDGYHGADFWSVEYRLPLSLIQGCYGESIKPGLSARGNFYKCGDDAEPPHFGAWSPVLVPRPDFHQPDCFGRLIFR